MKVSLVEIPSEASRVWLPCSQKMGVPICKGRRRCALKKHGLCITPMLISF
nr:MAG TPA: hypothetical protein [Caudoviricetes sp.]DAQ87304.1 MAG TPA: hypothetical protein [Caudoviricetes sp.]